MTKSNQNDSKTRLDRSNLAQLYPSAKTYQQRRDDDRHQQEMRQKRLPKYPTLRIAVYGSISLGLVAALVLNIERLWMNDSITPVFLSFAAFIGLIFTVFAWVKYCLYIGYVYDNLKVLIGVSAALALVAATALAVI